jgi:CheY-like chemotaxis protein
VPTILIVDDDLNIRREVSEILGEEGFDVLVASGGAEALRILATSARPAVILLDLVMPRTDGWDLRRAQLADPRLASIPVLVFSSLDGGPRDVADLRAAGFVAKPFTIAQLLGAIERFREA